MMSAHALAQDPPAYTPKNPSVDELQEMKRALEQQQKKIEKLKQEAQKAEEELWQMQRQVEDKLGPARAAATPAEKPVPPATPAKTIAPALAQVNNQDPNSALPSWAVLKISDTVNFRFGALVQPVYEALQDPNSQGYSQNFYLQRASFSILGTLGAGVSVFYQVQNQRVGYAGNTGLKNTNAGFQIQDAYAQWAFGGKALKLQAGLFLVPTIRQALTRYSASLAPDLPTWSMQEGVVEESTLGRDYGVGFNGALLENDHLSYRVGVFSGYRNLVSPQQPRLGPAAGSRNPPRIAGRIMYDFFDPEAAYAYIGTSLGMRKVASIGFVGDGQGDYKGFGGDAFFDWPLGPGAVTAEADYMHFDGGSTVYTIGGTPTRLPEQQTFYINVGYYFTGLKLQPFFRCETLTYAEPVDIAKQQERVGGGFNYYVYGQNFKATVYYERIMPKVQPPTAAIKNLNRFVLRLQGFF